VFALSSFMANCSRLTLLENTTVTSKKPVAAKWYFFLSKIHENSRSCIYNFKKDFRGLYPRTPIKLGRGRRGGEGKEEKGREGEKGNGIRGEVLPLYPAEEMIRSSWVGVGSTRHAQLNNLIP
jgi:hypothetical protein